jgi:glycosyltransferase involved in cell wall biosynthesis
VIRRILYFSPVDLAASDGPGTNEFEFTLSLSERFGQDAWCVVPKPTSDVAHLEHMNTCFFALPELRTGLGFILSRLKMARAIKQLVRENDIDLVVGRLGGEPFVPWLLQRLFCQEIAIKTVGRWWFDGPPISRKEQIVRAVYGRLSVSVLKSAFAVDAGMQELVDTIEALRGGRRHVKCIPNAANTERFKPMEDPPDVPGVDLSGRWPVLGFVGTSPSLRGARQMVEVARAILTDYPDTAVLVAGSDDGMEDVLALARRIGVEDRCCFPGTVSYADVPALINRMTIGYSFFEPWVTRRTGNASQKVRQYLACGKPVISIKEGHEFLEREDLGSTVDPERIQEVEAATRMWLSRIKSQVASGSDRLRTYAVAHLSTEKALTDRLQFWLECRQG